MNIIVREFGYLCAALFGIFTLIFVAFAILPVDPARAVLGPMASEDAVRTLRSEYGLDAPLGVRFGNALIHVAQGDFGESFFFQEPASRVVLRLAPTTLMRTGLSLMLGLVGGIVAARLLGNSSLGRWLRELSVLAQSVPSFIVMLCLLWAISRAIGATPLGYPTVYKCLAVVGSAAYPFGAVAYFCLERVSPAQGTPRHVEFLCMLDAPRSYVLSTLIRESLPGAVAIALNALSVVLTSVMFAELIFGLRGFGLVFIRSCERGDLSVVMAGSMLLCVLVIGVQRVADVVLRRCDPRISVA